MRYGEYMRKRRICKFLVAMVAAAMVAALCFTLVACNGDAKRKRRDAQERAESVRRIEDDMLAAMGEGWSVDMTDEGLIALDRPGDYIVAKGWTALFGDTLEASVLQTAKLKRFATVTSSEEGKALMSDFADNAEHILPLLREVGLTKEDISTLFYDMTASLIKECGGTLNAIFDELMSARQLAGLGAAGRENVSECIADINAAKTDLVPSESRKQEMTAAFEDARGAIEGTIAFAYDMFFGALSDDMWEQLFASDGALVNITDSEIELVVSALLQNISALKATFTDEQIVKLNGAFDLLIDCFDEEVLTSVLYGQVVTYAKYANMIVGAAPLLLDVISAAGKTLGTPDMLAQLRDNFEGWNMEDGTMLNNVAVMTAKAVTEFLDGYDAASLKAALNRMMTMSGAGKAGAAFDMDISALILAVDAMINIADTHLDEEGNSVNIRHEDALSQQNITDMFYSAFALRANLEKFKRAYFDFRRGDTDRIHFLNALNACGFARLGVVYDNNAEITQDNVAEAYEFYMRDGVAAIKTKMSALTVKAARDMEMFVDDYYGAGSAYMAALNDIAERPIANEPLDDAQLAALNDALRGSGIMGMAYLVASLLA